MSDEIPPWERPEALARAASLPQNIQEMITALDQRVAAEDAAIMAKPYEASEHMPVWEYIEDEDQYPTNTGCSCGHTGTSSEDSWKAHVNELQRRDRVRVWNQAIAYAERGGEPHGMPWKNPYEED